MSVVLSVDVYTRRPGHARVVRVRCTMHRRALVHMDVCVRKRMRTFATVSIRMRPYIVHLHVHANSFCGVHMLGFVVSLTVR